MLSRQHLLRFKIPPINTLSTVSPLAALNYNIKGDGMTREKMNERIIYLLERIGIIPIPEIQADQAASLPAHWT